VSFTSVQRFIAQLTLEAIADLGFALGGGQALHAHGYGERLSRDLDFYIPQFEQDLFDRAEAATLAVLRAHGYTAEVGHRDTWLRQILVTDPASGERVVLDLGQDYRQNPPVAIAGIGPVIDLPDAAASKARALNDRRAARDYLDIQPCSAARPGRRPACSPRCGTTCCRPSPSMSSRLTSPPRESRIQRTTTSTGSTMLTSPASPPRSSGGRPNCEIFSLLDKLETSAPFSRTNSDLTSKGPPGQGPRRRPRSRLVPAVVFAKDQMAEEPQVGGLGCGLAAHGGVCGRSCLARGCAEQRGARR
jgi:Nucleotidyl transferase AbiEii toxin, Type IV TA system